MILYRAPRIEPLADELARYLSQPPDDPMIEDIVLTSGGGINRWLAQRLSLSLGAESSDGVCARVSFLSLPQLEARLRPRPSPWSPSRLIDPLLVLLDDLPDKQETSQLRAFLNTPNRPNRRLSLARRIASLFSDHAHWATPPLHSWAGQPPSAMADQTWQHLLFSSLVDLIGTPGEDRHRLEEILRDWAQGLGRVAVFCPGSLSESSSALLNVFAQHHEILGFFLADGVSPASGRGTREGVPFLSTAVHRLRGTSSPIDPFIAQASSVIQLPDVSSAPTVLRAIQGALAGETFPIMEPDDSLSFHASHGLDRHVEVLREVITEILENDPSLHPREILVLTPRLTEVSGLIEASFAPDDITGGHPGRLLGVRVTGQTPDWPALCQLLLDVLDICSHRATAQDLVRVMMSEPVKNRLGLSETDRSSVERLITESGIRWGISATQRREVEMGGFPHNTWLSGLNRIALGAAMSESDLPIMGTVLPLDEADNDLHLTEALIHVISTIGSSARDWVIPATGAQWAQRLRCCLNALAAPDDPKMGVVSTLLSGLSSFTSVLSRSDVRDLCAQLAKEHPRRSTFLAGWLNVTDMASNNLVPFRVVVMMGLDSLTFPRTASVKEDDFAQSMSSSRPDDADVDRAHFRDAIMAARDKLVVIYTGFDPVTNAVLSAPSPVSDLMRIAQTVLDEPHLPTHLMHSHPSQPYSRSTHPQSTFDAAVAQSPIGLTASRGSLVNNTSSPIASKRLSGHVTHVDVTSIAEFFSSPADHWLRANTGVRSVALLDATPLPTQIPLTLDSLETWKIRDRMMRLLQRGHDPDQVMASEMARGNVPPHALGTAHVREAMLTAEAILRKSSPWLKPEPTWMDIDIRTDTHLTCGGRVEVYGDAVVGVFPGKVRPKHQIHAWIRLLALQTGHPERNWKAVLLGESSLVTLTGPHPHQASDLLSYAIRLYLNGLVSPLPLPPSSATLRGWYMSRNLGPEGDGSRMRHVDSTWASDWRDPAWRLLWETQEHLLREPSRDSDIRVEQYSSRFLTLTHGLYLPMMQSGGER